MFFHEVVSRGNIDEINRVLRSGSRIDATYRDSFSNSALHIAVNLKLHHHVIKRIIKKGYDINAQDRNGWTPLHCAAEQSCYKVCSMLMSKDAIDMSLQNEDGNSALHFLVRKSTNCDAVLYEQLLITATVKGASVYLHNNNGEMPLHVACFKGNDLAVKFLIPTYCHPDTSSRYGETGLHYAVKGMNMSTISLLFSLGTDPYLTSLRKETVFFLEQAKQCKSEEMINLLRESFCSAFRGS
eukprot:TRINITY_DN4744_c0_g1_i2.p1 TRINITY_DN4744_c0_g1~~TRINITY_DN4744_c0_g1_i2.p1  ORF type:complete len:241 (-),score=24.18 TRINITY_DN4744_c0_g1_i2:276-998(-)